MKKILAGILVLVLLMGLAGCSVQTEDIVGTWQRETLYIAHYNCETDMIVTFDADGTFGVVLVNHANNGLLNYAGGSWGLEEEQIHAWRGDGGGVMEFTYDAKTKTVNFEGYPFHRIDN